MKPPLILASGSPYRLELLQTAGYLVEVIPSDIAEPDLQTFSSLESGLIFLAHLKCSAVAQSHPRRFVLAADTISLVASQILGKPTDRAHAEWMLRQMSGITHEVWTGWALHLPAGFFLTGVEKTIIDFRTWTEAELEAYLDSHEWQGKCGAYGLTWPHDPMVENLRGSVSNVIGLPLEQIEAALTLAGYDSMHNKV